MLTIGTLVIVKQVNSYHVSSAARVRPASLLGKIGTVIITNRHEYIVEFSEEFTVYSPTDWDGTTLTTPAKTWTFTEDQLEPVFYD